MPCYKFVGSLTLAFPSEQCRCAHAGYRYDDRFRYGPPVIAGPARSLDLPVGRFLDRRVESYFWFSEKYFCSHSPQITSRTVAIPPHQRGVSRSSRTRGADAVDAAASGAQRGCRAGWRKARERSNGELTNDVVAYGEVVWS